MAVNESRSMRLDLEIGATEGTYKSLDPDRGGEEALDTIEARAKLDPSRYDVQHTPVAARHLPTGRWAKHRPGRGGWTY